MSDASTLKHIVSEQYRDSANLNARSRLHELYSTNSYGWFAWYFDHLNLPPACRILELGGGPAGLWRAVGDRLPSGWQVTLTDLSTGMVREAGQRLAARADQFQLAVADAQQIPFSDATFDVVIANHMLYHVPDRRQAAREIRRVLRPGGRLFAATNGARHMAEIQEMRARLLSEMDSLSASEQAGFSSAAFSLENGQQQLEIAFSDIHLERHPDSLKVTEAQPLVDYLLSMMSLFRERIPAEQINRFTGEIEDTIRRQGFIHITKDSGIFIAR